MGQALLQLSVARDPFSLLSLMMMLVNRRPSRPPPPPPRISDVPVLCLRTASQVRRRAQLGPPLGDSPLLWHVVLFAGPPCSLPQLPRGLFQPPVK
ncbi:acyl-coenzyme A synthetase ACSM4, mitochondrial [Platysternon megacephalum]|uniref:Acyl-coenzyme A synthetase ACSM4, mitochondrial n=1 Tax=Platysternon megacephalum TaxID=55544 RepID=A0A4D9E951_9SAUR|nr:acyl-coenzyme A synthetase ACSM4, mitochondrial [Platysternon megacephalum]